MSHDGRGNLGNERGRCRFFSILPYYCGQWKAESFMKVHRVPAVTHLSRYSGGGNGGERRREGERVETGERGKVLLISRSPSVIIGIESSFRSSPSRPSSHRNLWGTVTISLSFSLALDTYNIISQCIFAFLYRTAL